MPTLPLISDHDHPWIIGHIPLCCSGKTEKVSVLCSVFSSASSWLAEPIWMENCKIVPSSSMTLITSFQEKEPRDYQQKLGAYAAALSKNVAKFLYNDQLNFGPKIRPKYAFRSSFCAWLYVSQKGFLLDFEKSSCILVTVISFIKVWKWQFYLNSSMVSNNVFSLHHT